MIDFDFMMTEFESDGDVPPPPLPPPRSSGYVSLETPRLDLGSVSGNNFTSDCPLIGVKGDNVSVNVGRANVCSYTSAPRATPAPVKFPRMEAPRKRMPVDDTRGKEGRRKTDSPKKMKPCTVTATTVAVIEDPPQRVERPKKFVPAANFPNVFKKPFLNTFKIPKKTDPVAATPGFPPPLIDVPKFDRPKRVISFPVPESRVDRPLLDVKPVPKPVAEPVRTAAGPVQRPLPPPARPVVQPVQRAASPAARPLPPVQRANLSPARHVVEPLQRAASPGARPVVKPAKRAILPLAEPVQRAARPVVEPAKRSILPLAEPVQRAARPVVEPAKRSILPLAEPVQRAALPVAEPVKKAILPLAEPVQRAARPAARPRADEPDKRHFRHSDRRHSDRRDKRHLRPADKCFKRHFSSLEMDTSSDDERYEPPCKPLPLDMTPASKWFKMGKFSDRDSRVKIVLFESLCPSRVPETYNPFDDPVLVLHPDREDVEYINRLLM